MTDASQYKKLSHREHILELPDTYIGSCETSEEWRWVYNTESGKMVHKKVQMNPGFYKIFDEIIVNARDARVRSLEKGKTPIKKIDVVVKGDAEGDELEISVENDGDGIPIEQHPEHKVWVPELIFGHLLTSGNYNKEEEKIVGGKNGYGAKCSNVFSKTFTLETRNVSSGQKYTQTWSENMSKCGKPSIKADKGKTGYVRITYKPDLARFHGFHKEDMLNVLKTRAWELAALCGKDVKVSYNGEVISSNTFEKYVRLFVNDGASVVYEACGPRWEVAAVLSRTLYDEESGGGDEGATSVSFVNGINTRKGGKHVETVVRNVLGDFCEAAAKKKVPVKPAQIRNSVVFFVNATIVNPSFDSQSKETLTTAVNKFGSVFKSEKMSDGLMKVGLLEEAQAALEAKAAKDAKKTDGAKKKTLRGYPKLEDALWAGTSKSEDCTLILTEGDSAASSAIAGLNVVGREKFGIFPLKGKLMNVKDISQEKFNKNEELTAIKAILGLRQGTKYKDKKELRYGRVMVMADQDHDGSHIKGLLMNLFHTEWPDLMKMGFLCSLATPILKASKGKKTISFYTIGEYEAWKEANNTNGWTIKYYKGLGTSTKVEAREWFEKLTEIHYDWDEETDASMHLAFNKKQADDRKKWLASYDSKRVIDVGAGGHIQYTKFINDELIHFSNADNLRSLPHVLDGFKPSQRKVLYGCFKRNLRSEIKVAQLAGHVSEHTAYHHGEMSLNGTIVGMAQNFVGANNLNLLVPNGQFGSRLMGGKDAASPRYIFTYLETITDKIFRKEDLGILKNLEDDGQQVEPEYYMPILPMLLVNGCVGIGTGFSTDIPPYNPEDLVRVLKERIKGHLSTFSPMKFKPWWHGFKGEVLYNTTTESWVTKGKYTFDDSKRSVTLTELPVGVWTKDYKAFLDELAGESEGKLVGFDDLYTDDDVKFVLYLSRDYYEDVKADTDDFEKKFKLFSTWRTTNMVAFDKDMKITKYDTPGQILEAYYGVRLDAYEERRKREMERLKYEAEVAEARARFIKAVLEGSIELRRATDEKIVEMMKGHDLPALSGNSESVDGYEYLLKLRMDRVKATAVEEAMADAEKATREKQELEKTSAGQLWLKDLEEFETAWEKMKHTRLEDCMSAADKVKAKKPLKKSK
jgi:DNA topoisomerase-2